MEVFFYGLFMDQSILKKNGIHPSKPRKGYLNNYVLKIGERASLVPYKHEKAYGIVMTLDKDAVQKLYAESSVADYIPEEVTVTTDSNESITATCYNLPEELITGTNKVYAKALYALAKKENFPDNYIENILMMSKE